MWIFSPTVDSRNKAYPIPVPSLVLREMDFNQMNHDVLLRILSWTLWKDIPMLGVLRKTCKRFLALLTPASIGTWEESNTTSDFLHNCLPRDGAGYTEQWHLESPMALMRMFIPYVLYSGLETVGNLIYNIIPTAKNENEPADLFSILVCSVEWGVFVDVLGRSCLWISWRNLPCTSKADRESAAKHLFCLRCASLHFLEGFHYCYSDGISPDRDSSLEILNVGLRGSDDVCFRKLCVEGIWVSSTKSHVTVLRLHRKISDDLRQVGLFSSADAAAASSVFFSCRLWTHFTRACSTWIVLDLYIFPPPPASLRNLWDGSTGPFSQRTGFNR